MKAQSFVLCFLLTLLPVSCIWEEAPNAETDILSCTIDGDILKAKPEIGSESVTLTVKSDADITSLAPIFALIPGATIKPTSGTAFDFTTPRTYAVTSEDGHWTKIYTVRCIASGVGTEYHFGYITMEPKSEHYQIFYDPMSNGDSVTRVSGNASFGLTGVSKTPLDCPTMRDDNGHVGKCVKLVARSMGSFGSGLGMPIVAGNLFIGTSDLLNAIPNARRGARLRRLFDHVLAYLSGYHKYKVRESYKVSGEEVRDKKDRCDIYTIFYEADENMKYSDDFNGLTSPDLISTARISDQRETDEWTCFYTPFVVKPGKVIDKGKLIRGGYQLPIVFSSSLKGSIFEGAEGNTLWIDEVEIAQLGEN